MKASFSWMNKFRNLKTMNEAHFKLFILYVIDLHNLHIEKKVDLLANPLNPKRVQEIEKLNEDLLLHTLGNLGLQDEVVVPTQQAEEESNKNAATPLMAEPAKSEGFTELPNGELSCNYCTGTFKRMGNMRNHLNSKHQMSYELKCACGKLFEDSRKLSRHMKSCKT